MVIENIADTIIGYNEDEIVGSKWVPFITYRIYQNALLKQRLKTVLNLVKYGILKIRLCVFVCVCKKRETEKEKLYSI